MAGDWIRRDGEHAPMHKPVTNTSPQRAAEDVRNTLVTVAYYVRVRVDIRWTPFVIRRRCL